MQTPKQLASLVKEVSTLSIMLFLAINNMCVSLFSLRLFLREVNIKSMEIPILFVKKDCDGSCIRLFFQVLIVDLTKLYQPYALIANTRTNIRKRHYLRLFYFLSICTKKCQIFIFTLLKIRIIWCISYVPKRF